MSRPVTPRFASLGTSGVVAVELVQVGEHDGGRVVGLERVRVGEQDGRFVVVERVQEFFMKCFSDFSVVKFTSAEFILGSSSLELMPLRYGYTGS